MPNKTTRMTSRSVKSTMTKKEQEIMMVRKTKTNRRTMLKMIKIRRMAAPSRSVTCSST